MIEAQEGITIKALERSVMEGLKRQSQEVIEGLERDLGKPDHYWPGWLRFCLWVPDEQSEVTQDAIDLWACPICHNLYTYRTAAIVCGERGREVDDPVFEVGDLVTADHVFGWYDGDPEWVIEATETQGRMMA